MIELCNANQCTGCGACENACSMNCITMQADKDGFFSPTINFSHCVHCNACVRVCPVLNPPEGNEFKQAFCGDHISKEIKAASSSGGLFSALADCVMDVGGIVFGARFDDTFLTVFHTASKSKTELAPLRESKYLQSRIGLCYRSIKKFLDNEKLVLFSGTPCQVAGLRSFLKKDSEYLYTVDFICHGVISEKAYSYYLNEQLLPDEKLVYFSFRDKGHGNGYLNNHAICYRTDKGREYSALFDDDELGFGYGNNLLSRKCCSSCRYASVKRISDLTLCDYPWDLSDEQKEYGASGLLVNTSRGEDLLKKIDKSCVLKPIAKELIVGKQMHLRHPSVEHVNRDHFFADLDKGFSFSAQKHFCEYQPKTIRKKNSLILFSKSIKKRLKYLLRDGNDKSL